MVKGWEVWGRGCWVLVPITTVVAKNKEKRKKLDLNVEK